ncbi:MAG TPA: YbjN domain-containing protein [Solirubrobacteraceae bacterium]|nr:YbjN domain-containing protein [Solirubrobacteraceae bacterium]
MTDDTVARISAFVDSLDGDARRVSPTEWGISVDAAGWPLHVGVALRGGLLRAQAQVVEPGQLDPELLLRFNRQLPLVRFSHTAAGDVYVQGELPPAVVDAHTLDSFLGMLVRAATLARERATDQAALRDRSR